MDSIIDIGLGINDLYNCRIEMLKSGVLPFDRIIKCVIRQPDFRSRFRDDLNACKLKVN